MTTPDDPRLAHLQDDNDSFFIFYSDEAAAVHGDGWQHWQENRAGWNIISREELWDRTAWWVRNSKLHHTISELLWYYDEDDIEVVEQSDGRITLSVKYNPSETSPSGLKDEQLTFTLVIDEDSYEVERFEWVHRNHDSTYCHTYNEEGKDIEYGVKIDIPTAIKLSVQNTACLDSGIRKTRQCSSESNSPTSLSSHLKNRLQRCTDDYSVLRSVGTCRAVQIMFREELRCQHSALW